MPHLSKLAVLLFAGFSVSAQTDTAIDWRDISSWVADSTGISNAAQKPAVVRAEGVAEFRIEEPYRGARWVRKFPKALNLGQARYAVIRYRAERTSVPPGYFPNSAFVEIDSGRGSVQTLLSLGQMNDDGRWHVFATPLRKDARPEAIRVQLHAGLSPARAWLDYVKFSAVVPLTPLRDHLPYSAGWSASRMPQKQFVPVALGTAVNSGPPAMLQALSVGGWFTDRRATVEGIPFEFASGARQLALVPGTGQSPPVITLDRPASEVYLLIGAALPPLDESGMGDPRPFAKFSDPERLVARVRYRDGVEDLMFPVRVRSRRYEVVSGLDVYCLPGLRKEAVASVAVESRMAGAKVFVAAVTANTGQPFVTEPTVSALPPPVAERKIAGGKPAVAMSGDTFTLTTATLRASFSTGAGLRLTALENKCLRGGAMTVAPGSFFELGVGERVLTSDRLKVGAVRQEGAAVVVEVDGRPEVPLSGTLRLTAAEDGEIRMALRVKNVSGGVVMPVVNFPALSRVVLGDVENTWYFYAREGGIINRVPTRQREPYSGRYPLQVMGLFNPRLGGGAYLLVRDLKDIYKYYVTEKSGAGVEWRVEYFPREYQAGEEVEVAETGIGGHTGDWRAELGAYRRWVASWYRPMVARKDWFRDVYNYRQHGVWIDLYDRKTGTYRMKEIADKDREIFGRIDYLHIIDFGESKQYGRVGDYTHYDEIGGREKLSGAIAGLQESGVPVGVYIEGYLCDERGVWGRSNVRTGHIVQKDGTPLLWPGTPTEHMMCPASRLWQDHLASVYRRVASELKPNGMYIDQLGFANEWKICWSREHGHPVPWDPVRGERDLLRKIRDAVPPQIATLTEEAPTDVNSQAQDGALGYSATFNDPVLAPHHADLLRFVLPDFKIFQLVSYNSFVDGGWELLKIPFFNAEGLWTHNWSVFEPAAREFEQKALRVLHAYPEAFRTANPEPLVRTEKPLVHANAFPGKREKVWTLFNAGYRTVRGTLLLVPHVAGATYRDAWTGVDLKPEIVNGRAALSVTLGPRAVGCVVQVRR